MRKARLDVLLIAGIGALFFLPFLGNVHLFDWDEINFAEISREMILLQDYLRIYVNFEPFWQKPPLFFWLQVLSMKLWGINEYAARFPNAICGVVTLPILYCIGKQLYSRTFGWLWVGAYVGSILPHLYFKSGIIDPWFNLFIFLGLYFLIIYYWKKHEMAQDKFTLAPYTYLLLGGFILGMAILTKGPAAYLIVGLVLAVYWVREKFRFFISVPEFILFSVMCTLVSLAWFGLETWKNGPSFSIAFIRYNWELFSTHSAGHKGFPGYHFVVLLIGCFPASIYALRSFRKVSQEY
ncbi:MAG: glycosyltransferase family 39 protein, partial [Bacteroidota bacterium]